MIRRPSRLPARRRAAAAAAAVVVAALGVGLAAAAPGRFVTHYERSGGLETPRYAETVAYAESLALASPLLFATSFGVSPQGRPLPLLIADRDGCFTPEAARAAGRAVCLIQACIHAGEPDGKDAGLMLLRDIALRGRHPDLLRGVTILFIPILNVDGHERFGPHSRINQNGPREMGWRATAQGLNLNRDHLKADAPEMRAWLRLFIAWLPDFLVDVHVTDGADYQYTLTYSLEVYGNLDPGLTAWARGVFLPGLAGPLAQAGHPLAPYVWFRDWHDPRSGLVVGAASPRLSTGYAAVQNRPALLVETHMLKDYRTRVEATYELLRHTLAVLERESARLACLTAVADSLTASPAFAHEPLALRFSAGPDSSLAEFLGFDYDIVTSDLTGGPWVRYGKRPRTWLLPLFDDVQPTLAVIPPAAYIIPPEWQEVIGRLIAHGVRVRRLEEPVTLPVQSYRFRAVQWRERPYEGRHPLTFQVEEIAETRTFPAGSAVVQTAQRAGRVAVHALEPQGPDSFVHWGFFDPIFEQKEYAEAYVMEGMAREMLAADPELRREFEERRAADPVFAGSQAAVLDWFFRRTPYWDDRLNVYPVGRIVDPAAVPR